MHAESIISGCSPSVSLDRYARIRARTLHLVAPLAPEDTVVQSMPDASPAKWHLAHTTWFFEQFVLAAQPGYRPWRGEWAYLFNSYYEAVGPRHARPERGLLTRPTLDEVIEYREQIDARMQAWFTREPLPEQLTVVELGLQHEQQHQELVLTDLKHLLSRNPLRPVYRDDLAMPRRPAPVPLHFIDGPDGIASIGHRGDGFAFDCETPRHQVLLQPHALANRPVSNGEFREFVRDGGYRTPGLWLSEGWATVQREGWTGPAYWLDDGESEFTLGGARELDPLAPVCHVSHYEADAFARWAGARLPTEAEWETSAANLPSRAIDAANLADDELLQPQAPVAAGGALQMYGDVWEWTASPYVPYPRFKPLPGALGEYNGKFMSGQWVLRGGSCATPAGHLRATYRNFFYPKDRWQFSGFRLAQDR